jgi:hypothetical protein
MKSISFDEGYREYKLNGDDSRVIRIQITDPNLYSRIEKGMEKAESLIGKYKNTDSYEKLAQFDKEVKAILNEAFGTDICTPAFGSASVLTPTSDGSTLLIYAFFEAFMPALKEDIESMKASMAQEVRPEVKKYLDVSVLTEEEKQALREQLA